MSHYYHHHLDALCHLICELWQTTVRPRQWLDREIEQTASRPRAAPGHVQGRQNLGQTHNSLDWESVAWPDLEMSRSLSVIIWSRRSRWVISWANETQRERINTHISLVWEWNSWHGNSTQLTDYIVRRRPAEVYSATSSEHVTACVFCSSTARSTGCAFHSRSTSASPFYTVNHKKCDILF